MILRISSEQRQILFDWAAEAGSVELCGLLFGENEVVTSMKRTKNIAFQPKTQLEIDPAALIRAEKAARAGGPAIIGYFHSHLTGDSRPSATDASLAAADGRFWLIIAGADIGAWRAIDNGAVHGRFQPVELRVEA